MRKIQYNVVERDTKNASGKAKTDVMKILDKYGFKRLYSPSPRRTVRVLQQLSAILVLRRDDCIFVQYPANIDFCYKVLAKKRCEKIAIIHDLESLRRTKNAEEEFSVLRTFDLIISHNAAMTKFLREGGIEKNVVDLNIFDYLSDENTVSSDRSKFEVAFAGNLVKSKFLFELEEAEGINFLIYGNKIDGTERLSRQSNVDYKGGFPSDKLTSVLNGGWGLVWDGERIDCCSGAAGEYMRYNCPHKASMYVVSERPIIIWDGAAMADYITGRGLGIAVSSLRRLRREIESVTDARYQEMLNNVKEEKERLIKGGTLGNIVEKYVVGKIC